MIDPGSQLGPYLIDREIGRGGMALVYHARDERTGDDVALKVLLPNDVHNPALLRRFQQEGEIALRLRHPNIVRAHTAGVLEGYYYIALDYAPRGTLATLAAQRRAPVRLEETVQLLRRVALALDYAHSRAVLHRDVKPSNILLGPNSQIWLADFGVARRLDADYIMLTGGAQPIGTPSFMSPEQIRNDANIDGLSDIYSLGVVAYKLLSGGLPFAAKTQVTLLHKIAYDPPKPAQEHNSRLTAGTCFVLERVLAKNPAARYRTASAFIDALAASPHLAPTKTEWTQLRGAVALPQESEPKLAQSAVKPPEPRQPSPPAGRRWAEWLGKPVGWLVTLTGIVAVALAGFLWMARSPAYPAGVVQATAKPMSAPLPTGLEEKSTATAMPVATVNVAALVTTVATFTVTPLSTATPGPEDESSVQGSDLPVADIAMATGSTPVTSLASAAKPATSTPVPELATDTPTPTEAPTRLVLATPVERTSAAQADAVTRSGSTPAISVQLLSPRGGDSVDGARTFIWQPIGTLPAGYSFEPIFWASGQDPLVEGRGWGGITSENQLPIDLTKFSEVQPGSYQWGIRLVQVDPYQPIKLISEVRTIIVQRQDSSSSGGGNKVQSTPTPSGGDDRG